MSSELILALNQLEKEKGIDKEVIIEAIEAALISAYKRNFSAAQNVRVELDRASGDYHVYAQKTVVEDPENEMAEMSLEQARLLRPTADIEDIVEIEVTPKTFGRIAAQTAKQVVVQRLREAERGIVYDTYYSRENDIVSAIIQRIEKKNVVVELGRTEAVLLPSEQVASETYNFNERMKMYVVEVRKTSKGPQVILSRTHPGLVKRLFEMEVPEIHDGTVEIKSISREAGSRTKIAVWSRDNEVDPVGACVGQKGTRVQNIVDELRGEKIDIIKWSADPVDFISSALSPAKVIRVDILEAEKGARVIVPDYQLSLAIGKEGQNARLAAKLTGWKIDIKSESQLRSLIEQDLFGDMPADSGEED